jgi:hypothetical protein
MCGYAEPGAPSLEQRLVDGFMVTRTWSNAAAERNADPCVPPIGTPYFVAVPDLGDMVRIEGPAGPTTTGVRLAVGEAKTIVVRLSSTGPTPDWTVYAVALPALPSVDGGAPAPTLDLSWDRQTGNDGDVLHLTIRRLADDPTGGTAIGIYSVPTGTSPEATIRNASYAYVATERGP